MDSDTTSLLSRQPSGIRALPSHDDDDDDNNDEFYDDFDANSEFQIDNSVVEFDKINEIEMNSNYNSWNNSSSSSVSSSSLSSESNGGLVSVSGPKGAVPVAKVSGEVDDDDDEIVGEEEEEMSYGGEKVVPRVRVVGEEDDGDDEWNESLEVLNADEGVEEGDVTLNVDEGAPEKERVESLEIPNVDEGAPEKERVELLETPNVDEDAPVEQIVGSLEETPNVNEGARKVKSFKVDGDKDEAINVDEGAEEEHKVESLEAPNVDKGGDEEQKVESLEGVKLEIPNVDEGAEEEQKVESLKVVDELDGDAIVDSINVDVVETIRSGVAVVGVSDKTENEVASVDVQSIEMDSSVFNSDNVDIVEDKVEMKGSDVEVGGGDKMDSSVDAVESSSVVAEDKEKEKDSEVEESAALDSVAEAAGVKLTDEGDVVVDSINVDAAEAVRSGTAIVGEVGEARDSGAEAEKSVVEDSVAENYVPECPKAVVSDEVNSVDESDSVVDGIQVDVVEAIRSGVAVVGESKLEGTELEEREVVAPIGENVVVANEFEPLVVSNSDEIINVPGDQLIQTQIDESEAPQSVEVLNTEETDAGIKKRVPDEPDASSVLIGGEKASNRSYADVLVNGLDIDATELEQTKTANETEVKAEDGINVAQENGDDEGSNTDGEDGRIYFGSRSPTRQATEELETHDHSGMLDGQVVTDSEGDSDEEGEGNELFNPAALAALLKAATGAGTDPGTITVRSQDGSRLFSMERPAGLEPSLRSARPTIGSNNSSFFNPSNLVPPSDDNLSEDDKKRLQNLQQLKVKFLRLVQRLGFTAEHSLAAQVLYKLTVFAGRPVSPAFSLDNAKQTAMQLEAEGKDDLDFSFNILVLGKTGVGKSAIINSIFGEEKVKINAFEPETTFVNEVCGTVDGVKIRFIDAPGLKTSATDQGFNRKVLASVKKLTKKCPPDVMFYVDRLDSQTRDLNDLPLLKTISNSLGASVWRNAIITLTHSASAPPDGPSGTPLSYEVFVAQRSHIVQQLVGQAVGDMRLMNLNMNPVSLVENHPACRKNRDGQKILPNGQAWRPQLLLLCYSVKILSEATATSKSQDTFDARKLFGFRARSPPLPYLLSSLLQPRAHPKLTADQGGDNVDSDIDLDDVSDSDQEEEEEEYDQLPPFKPLKKSQLAKLSGEQKKAYFEEYDYRVKLLQRKQWSEELKRMREMKNGKNGVDAYGEMPEDFDGENGAPAAVQVPLPDMTLPPSFDSDNPAYRYRFLEPTSQFLARPVLDPHGWDHDCGYEGVNIEQNMGIAGRFPAAYTVQLTKDKKDFNVHLDSAVSAKHGESGSSLVGFDVQTIGKQYAYIVRGESKFKNLKKNKTAAGVTVTFLGENVATGVKVEDQIMLGKRLVLVGSTGTVRSQKDAAYGANLEVRLREADYPIGQEQSSFTLSLMKWRGDLAIGANLQSQVSVGRNSKVAVRAALNNKMSGQITVRTSSSDHLSLALAGLMPIAIAIYQKFRPGEDIENYSIY